MRRRSNITIGRAEEAVMNVPHEAILRAFLMGAPMEAINVLLGWAADIEGAIRAELNRIAQEHSGNGARRTARKPAPAKPVRRTHRAAKRKSTLPEQSEPEPRGTTATWLDTLRTALATLGPSTVDEIEQHLTDCDVPCTTRGICRGLAELRRAGEIQHIRQGGVPRWRLAEQ
jgi:hypothetical protein